MNINLNTIIWLVLSIILIGFFAGIEIAFVSVNRLTVELRKKQGKNSGILFSQLMAQPSKFIGATLVGFNACLVIYGLLVGEILSPVWSWIIRHFSISETFVNTARLLIETFLGTAFILVFGLFLPKAIWRAKSELLLNALVSRIVNFFYQAFHPVASFFVAVSE